MRISALSRSAVARRVTTSSALLRGGRPHIGALRTSRSSHAVVPSAHRLSWSLTTLSRNRTTIPTRAASANTLVVARRAQSSLQKLLDDPSDPYLAALQDFDLPRIAAVLEAGPATTDVPASFLCRVGIRTDNDVMATTRAQHAAPTPLTQRPATSSAEAVLQSLHAAGAARQREEEAAAAAEMRTAQAAYEALSAAEKAELQRERLVSHLFDGLCAMSAATRVQAEDGPATPEQLEAMYTVYAAVMRACRDGTIAAQRWEEDFAAEMAEMRVLWEHLDAPKPLPSEKGE